MNTSDSPYKVSLSAQDDPEWKKALDAFREKMSKKIREKDRDKLEAFLNQSCAFNEMVERVEQSAEKANQKYTVDAKHIGANALKVIRLNIAMIMEAGALATQANPYASLAWTGVTAIVNIIVSDMDKCEVWAAAGKILTTILSQCRILAGLYRKIRKQAASAVLNMIPEIYEKVLDFSWAAHRRLDRSALKRMFKDTFITGEPRASAEELQSLEKLHDSVVQKSNVALQERSLQHADITEQELAIIKRMSTFIGEQMSEIREWMETWQASPEAVEQQLYLRNLKKMTSKEQTDRKEHVERIRNDKENMLQKFPSTCKWISQCEQYSGWREKNDNILWITSNQRRGGYGKSVSVTRLIQHLEEEMRADQDIGGVVYYYCSKSIGQDSTHKANGIRQELVRQLYEQIRETTSATDEIRQRANSAFEIQNLDPRKGKAGNTGKTVIATQASSNDAEDSKKSGRSLNWEDVFLKLARAANKTIFVIVDALDECSDLQDDKLIETFHNWQTEMKGQLKIAVTSRPGPHVDTTLPIRPDIKIKRLNVEEHTNTDLKSVAHEKIAEISSLLTSERDRIVIEIVDKAQGQFTYMTRAISFFSKPFVRPIENVINQFRGSEKAMMQALVRNTDPNYEQLLKHTLTWVILQQEDLEVNEIFESYSRLYDFATDTQDDYTYDEMKVQAASQYHQKLIANAAGDFVDFRFSSVSGRIYTSVNHHSVRDAFLASNITDGTHADPLGSPEPLPSSTDDNGTINGYLSPRRSGTERSALSDSTFIIHEHEAHLQIAIQLLKHLNSPTFQKKFYKKFLRLKVQGSASTSRSQTPVEKELAQMNADQVNDTSDSNDVRNTDHQKLAGEGSLSPINPGSDSTLDQDANDGVSMPNEALTEAEDAQSTMPKEQDTVSNPSDRHSDSHDSRAESSVQSQHNYPTSSQYSGSIRGPASDASDTSSEEWGYLDEDRDWEEVKNDTDESLPDWRYETMAWAKHIKLAERLRQSDDQNQELWNELWEQLKKFFIADDGANSSSPTPFNQWLLNTAHLLDSDVSIAPVAGANPLHICAHYGLRWVYGKLKEENVQETHNNQGLWPFAFFPNNEYFTEDAAMLPNLLRPFRQWCRKPDQLLQISTKSIVGHTDTEATQTEPIQAIDLPGIGDKPAHNDDGSDSQSSDWNPPVPDSLRLGCWLIMSKDPPAEFIQALIDEGLPVDIRDREDTLFHMAARSTTKPDVVDLLHKHGVDINATTSDDWTPLHELLFTGVADRYDVLEAFLKNGASVSNESNVSVMPLVGACVNGDLKAVKLIVEKYENDFHDEDVHGDTALLRAAQAGQQEVVEYLFGLDQEFMNAETTTRNKRGETALYQACSSRTGEAVARWLLQHLIGNVHQINLPADDGRSPLHRACANGMLEFVQEMSTMEGFSDLLLQEDRKGRTPLHMAVMGRNLNIVKLLLTCQANPKLFDRKWLTPIHLAIRGWMASRRSEFEKIIQALIESDNSLLHIVWPTDQLATSQSTGDTILHLASARGSVELVRYVLDRGFDANARDQDGWTALLHARDNGHKYIEELIVNRIAEQGQMPSGFEEDFKRTAKIEENGLLLTYNKLTANRRQLALKADHPVPYHLKQHYFEICFEKFDNLPRPSLILVGYSTHPSVMYDYYDVMYRRTLGSDICLFATVSMIVCSRSLDTRHRKVKHTQVCTETGERPISDIGTTVGCLLDLVERRILFTLNGKILKERRAPNATTDVPLNDVEIPISTTRLWPAIGFVRSTKLRVNFGADLDKYPFAFDPKTYRSEDRET